ncbi:hypothetical protein DU000_11075 [Parvibium lacunae]|uniref:Kazal-like domain-containing protein n=1 Tax=Parvibium lacunae TaxID=1888893 RepID=A0A368L020_9BURK|nr:hypothetical protein DU000_11075 [Parvibium lacunae]
MQFKQSLLFGCCLAIAINFTYAINARAETSKSTKTPSSPSSKLTSGGPSGCTVVIDPQQPPTAYMCKEPLPAMICDAAKSCDPANLPGSPVPGTFQCFVLPTHPVCANNCPIQFANTCG